MTPLMMAVHPPQAAESALGFWLGLGPESFTGLTLNPKLLKEVDAAGMTPLMTAVSGGKHKVIKALLKAEPTAAAIANAEGYSVMHVAADLGRDRVLQNLITHGLNPRDRHADGLTPMHRAVINGHTDAIKSLFNAELSGTVANPHPHP
jgi:ankyrin repeat protein